MPSASAVPAIGSRQRVEFGAHEMFDARSAVTTLAIDPDLVNKI